MTMQQVDVRDATHVKVGCHRLEKIERKWGIDRNGRLAKPSEGGFGVITDRGECIDMWTATSYWKCE
jgi:hypothetical protein